MGIFASTGSSVFVGEALVDDVPLVGLGALDEFVVTVEACSVSPGAGSAPEQAPSARAAASTAAYGNVL
ncbi:MAG: hypothetical protein ACTHJJ_01175 [Intrasporangium sp.]|uniref:hypothetical protein n=1 Tax=Intrasporangium sp. TaxID=1925024 RepID=UPI003F7E4603